MGRSFVALVLLSAAWGCSGFESASTPPRPRLVAPLSTATVSSLRPTLRFSLPPPLRAPIVELCAHRSCDGAPLTATVDDSGTRAVPDSDLAPGLWYWRVRVASASSAVWQFQVQPSGGAESSWGSQLDLNGDGFAELAVAAPFADLGMSPSAGRVYLYVGAADGPDPTQPLVIDGPSGGGQFGQSLAAVDFDGDGFADLAVGAPTLFSAGELQGAVYIFRGGPDGIQLPAAYVLGGMGLDSRALGWSLDSAGDVDGDGYGDLVTGAPTTVLPSGSRSGAAYILFGGPASGRQIEPLMPEDNQGASVGWAVAGGGDLDGDGLADVLVGAPGAESGAGHAFVYFNSGNPVALALAPSPLAELGSALVQLGDTDGDGRADFAVSAPSDGSGRVYQFSGDATPRLTGTLDGPDPGPTSFGAVMAAADVDGDGKNDLIVTGLCSPGGGAACPGAVFLVAGGALTRIAAPPGALSYGIALSTGDCDGDGRADLIIGASESNNQLGRVDWYRDAAPSAAPRVFNGSDAGGRYGFAVR